MPAPRGPQPGDQRQDVGKHPSRHRDLGHLERDVASVGDNLRADLDQLLAQASQRASQKPSRPASKATAIRVIVRPALTASSCQRCSQTKQPFWARLQLLARLTVDAGKHAGNQPARLA